MNISTATTYEYATIRVDRDREGLYADTYRTFGWTVEVREDPLDADTPRPLPDSLARSVPLVGRMYRAVEDSTPQANTITLRLKRDRHIANRAEVVGLQHQAEAALADIDRLERSAHNRANAASLGLGLIGAALLAGSVFSLTAGLTIVMVVLGALGLLTWLGAFLANAAVRRTRTGKVAPALEAAYATVYAASERGAHLLYA